MKRMPETAVLLAAGRGRRLRPYTDHVPKPLLPVNGRPTLDYVLLSVAAAGSKVVCLVTHHLSEQIEAYAGDGSAWNLEVVYCRQTALRGTAHALQEAVACHPALFTRERPFILTATDYILPGDYIANLVAAHMESDVDMTISLKKLPPQEIVARSSVRFKKDGTISRIIEKPTSAEILNPLTASLTYILPGYAADYLIRMEPSERGEFEIADIINKMLVDGFTARGFLQAAPPEWDETRDGNMSLRR